MTQSNIGMACCREGGDTGILCSVANFTPHLIQAESLTLVAEIALGFLVANVRLRPIGPDRNAQDAPHGLRLVGFCALRSSSQAHWGMKGRALVRRENEHRNPTSGSLQDFVVNLPTWCPQFLSPALMFQISVDVAHLQCCSHSPTFPLVGIGCYRLPFCPWSFSEYTVYCILIFFISYP